MPPKRSDTDGGAGGGAGGGAAGGGGGGAGAGAAKPRADGPSDVVLKVLVLGDAGTGKTSIIKRCVARANALILVGESAVRAVAPCASGRGANCRVLCGGHMCNPALAVARAGWRLVPCEAGRLLGSPQLFMLSLTVWRVLRRVQRVHTFVVVDCLRS
jgi:hypothetical protein